ncbi:AAA family ATPase [Pontiellaceae bacterium B12227]|nr:AAA family ATPase [Pontiellaceae bacterium B12227]
MNPIILRINEWATDRYTWQLDAIRRICENGSVTENDIEELEHICLRAHEIRLPEGAAVPEPVSLNLEGNAVRDEIVSPVRLSKVANVQHVNRLAAGQELTFAPEGLTIVYGNNGAGKSGYGRILRNACRARYQNSAVKSDVFTPSPGEPSSAQVDYSVGDDAKSCNWVSGQQADAELINISVFDSDCAAVHVTAENDLAFTPAGLDVLPKVGSLFRTLRDRLSSRKQTAESARSAVFNDVHIHSGTQAARRIGALRPDTNVEELSTFAQRSDAEVSRQEELVELLAHDPATHARMLGLRKDRITQLAGKVSRGTELLTDDAVMEIRRRWDVVIAAKGAAEAAATDLFQEGDLPGLGNAVWRNLWEAAKTYSESSAYPDVEFPNISANAVCVLCQQPVQGEASQRLARFDEFVKGETQRQAGIAEMELGEGMLALGQLDLSYPSLRDLIEELKLENEALAMRVRRAIVLLRLRRRRVIWNAGGNIWNAIPELPEDLVQELQALALTLVERQQEAQRASQADERAALQQELRELKAREWLEGILENVPPEIDRLSLILKLDQCIGDVSTDAVTRKNTELTDEFVTETLCDAFAAELDSIGLNYLNTELVKVGGHYGMSRYQVQLTGVEQDARLMEVVSEGELRSIALSAFLAELSTSDSSSGIVFDDPVSSLDHIWRERIASRLIREASDRQVVIFTHDIVFVMTLLECAQKADVAHLAHCIERAGAVTGKVRGGLPWNGLKVNSRIGVLRVMWGRAEKVFRTVDEATYEPLARDIYGALRESWERGIEEVLFNDVIQRLRRSVETRRIRQVAGDISVEDYNTIDENMTLCSRYLRGHDDATPLNEPMPDPEGLKGHIDALEVWVSEVRQRRR